MQTFTFDAIRGIDDDRSGQPHGRGFSVTADAGGTFDVWQAIGDTVFARGRVTGTVVMVEQTGTAVRSGQVRVRITPGNDTGDAAGTLSFDPVADGFGGVAPVDVFA